MMTIPVRREERREARGVTTMMTTLVGGEREARRATMMTTLVKEREEERRATMMQEGQQ